MTGPSKEKLLKRKIHLAGQTKHKSLQDVLDHISKTMGEIHTQTHEKIKAERRGPR